MAETELNSRIEGFLNNAFRKYMVRDFDGAIRDLKASEVLDPDNPEVLYNLGVNYCRMGLHATAGGYFTRLLQLERTFINSLEVRKLLAYCLIQSGKHEDAARHLDRVLELAPEDCVAMNMRAYCSFIAGDSSGSIRLYRSILEIDERNFNAYNSIAYLLARTGGDLSSALTYAKTAYDSNRTNAAYLDTVGYVYLKLGDAETARSFLTRAFERAPLSEEIKDHMKELRTLEDSRNK